MLPDSIHRAYRTTALHSAAALSLVAGLFFSTPVYAQLTMDQWRETMWAAALPMLPMSGRCYKSDFPDTVWQAAPCSVAPLHPQVPIHGNNGSGVGSAPTGSGGDVHDLVAEAPSGLISSAIGTLSVAGALTETGPIDNDGNTINTENAYSLQMNTNFFGSPTCSNLPTPANCKWQQFVFENTPSPNYHSGVPTFAMNHPTGARIYIQYWRIKAATSNAATRLSPDPGLCPAGWHQFRFARETAVYCYMNSPAITLPGLQPIQNLGNLSLKGAVSTTRNNLKFSTGSSMYAVSGDNAVGAAAGWKAVEFNVFGDGGNENGGGRAYFGLNAGAKIEPRIQLNYAGTAPRGCAKGGFTDEYNNLDMAPRIMGATAPPPVLVFGEQYSGLPYDCANATAVGDTHLTTFGGLLYDFQATGDFLLAETGRNFSVQTRQVSGAPTWPDAAVNQAVAVQSGRNRVAICLSPERLLINGKPVPTREGAPLPLPDGGAIVRTGNVYSVRGPTGDNVRATVYGAHVDVSVGLARWPEKVTGLLANADQGAQSIATRDGGVLTAPFSYDALYRRYTESWRVSPKDSMLLACGERGERGVPKQIFLAANLDPGLARQTRAICEKAGVKKGALLDACTLDVAVIGSPTAATVFTTAPQPLALGNTR